MLKKKYLGSYGEFVEVSLNAQEGDVIRGDYRTYDSPFFVGIGWAYLGESPKFDVFTTYYESGWFEIEICSEGSGTIGIVSGAKLLLMRGLSEHVWQYF